MRSLALIEQIRRFARAENGTTAIEYALIAVGISVVIVTVVTTLGQNVLDMWTSVSNGAG